MGVQIFHVAGTVFFIPLPLVTDSELTEGEGRTCDADRRRRDVDQNPPGEERPRAEEDLGPNGDDRHLDGDPGELLP